MEHVRLRDCDGGWRKFLTTLPNSSASNSWNRVEGDYTTAGLFLSFSADRKCSLSYRNKAKINSSALTVEDVRSLGPITATDENITYCAALWPVIARNDSHRHIVTHWVPSQSQKWVICVPLLRKAKHSTAVKCLVTFLLCGLFWSFKLR